jgi:anaerobic magnesium-protoporphyrin IX monomethyl ester cyclase
MKVALIGAELEENLGLRYMAASLEQQGHQAEIIAYNSERDLSQTVSQALELAPDIVGLSMVFTSRAREFCNLANALRSQSYSGHIIAGGHFAALNCQQLLRDFDAFDSVALGEGEYIICELATRLSDYRAVSGICYRRPDGTIRTNRSKGNPENLDSLPYPRRTTFHDYFGKPIASMLSSRGCWRNCAFCSINAWYKQGGGKKFRIRSIGNIVQEMKQLYYDHNVRIFNMQDDNFFLPNKILALRRFEELREALQLEGIEGIAIAVKARPDSITEEAIRVLDDLGLFRVFLGVENASEIALKKLNRKCRIQDILNALKILNNYDVHIAYNLLMFELDTTMEDILVNLRFIERHFENPFNFCRAEAYAGTGLEGKLLAEGRLLGDYFGIDYRLKDQQAEVFHKIANYAFFDRNFSENGLHYFNMQVDFYFQLLRRFHPHLLSLTLRSSVRNFIKYTNLDTYGHLCQIYDFVTSTNPGDQRAVHEFSHDVRERVDRRSHELRLQGENLINWINRLYEGRTAESQSVWPSAATAAPLFHNSSAEPYRGVDDLIDRPAEEVRMDDIDLFGLSGGPIPYEEFKRQCISRS